MTSFKNILFILSAIGFILVIGAGLYEHVAVVPRWSAAPPQSLSMLQGKYGLNPGAYWRPIHPIVLLLMIAALVANWRTARRKYILIAVSGYLFVLVCTMTYFVPELLSITGTPFSETVDQGLTARAALWEKLSLTRLAFTLVLASVLLTGLTKQENNLSLNKAK